MTTRFNPQASFTTVQENYTLHIQLPMDQAVRNLVQEMVDTNLFPEVQQWHREFITTPDTAEALCFLICRMLKNHSALEAKAKNLLARALQGSGIPADDFIRDFERYFPEAVQLQSDLAMTRQALIQNEREEIAFYERQYRAAERNFTHIQGSRFDEEVIRDAQQVEREIRSLEIGQTANQTRMQNLSTRVDKEAKALESNQQLLSKALSTVKK